MTRIIAIHTGNKSFNTSLLSRFLEEHLQVKCVIVDSPGKLPENCNLALLDCAHSPHESLPRTLNEISNHPSGVTTALLNAEHIQEHEGLLDWPSLFGLFYYDTEEDQLLRGIEQLLAGDYWVPRRLLHHFFNKHRQSAHGQVTPSPSIQLTNREREILSKIREGMSNSAVSETLELSEHTVKSHLYNIYKKIGVRNRMEASNWAREQQDLDAL